jgi:hypothetical protein
MWYVSILSHQSLDRGISSIATFHYHAGGDQRPAVREKPTNNYEETEQLDAPADAGGEAAV